MLSTIYKDRDAAARLDYLIGRWMERSEMPTDSVNGEADVNAVHYYRALACGAFDRIWGALPEHMRTSALAPAVLAVSLGEIGRDRDALVERKQRGEVLKDYEAEERLAKLKAGAGWGAPRQRVPAGLSPWRNRASATEMGRY